MTRRRSGRHGSRRYGSRSVPYPTPKLTPKLAPKLTLTVNRTELDAPDPLAKGQLNIVQEQLLDAEKVVERIFFECPRNTTIDELTIAHVEALAKAMRVHNKWVGTDKDCYSNDDDGGDDDQEESEDMEDNVGIGSRKAQTPRW